MKTNRNTDTYADRISEHFTWSEMQRSDTARRMGIDNTVPEGPARQAVILLVTRVLQPLRKAWGGPLVINSGYRSPELNEAEEESPAPSTSGERPPTSPHLTPSSWPRPQSAAASHSTR